VGYQQSTVTLLKEAKRDLLADFHSMLNEKLELYKLYDIDQITAELQIKSRQNMGTFTAIHFRVFLSTYLLANSIQIKIHRSIIMPVVLYGCETSSLALREEHRLRVFKNRVLRKIFGPKREEVTGDW
jgi:hypothetical protein